MAATATERTPVARVQARHGAWMIWFTGDHPADWPADEQFDCASSLAMAKRLAKEGARGYASNFRWEKSVDYRAWTLLGVERDWSEDYDTREPDDDV